jgi:hypothetical protein
LAEFLAGFASKRSHKGPTFKKEVFHPRCPLVKNVNLRLADWNNKEICRIAICRLTFKIFIADLRTGTPESSRMNPRFFGFAIFGFQKKFA